MKLRMCNPALDNSNSLGDNIGNGIIQPMQYIFDIRKRNVLICKRDKDSSFEILHKGDEQWKPLKPQPDYQDENYCRAMYLGQG